MAAHMESEGVFQGSYYRLRGQMRDLSPDGKRFLMIKKPAPTAEAPIPQAPRKISIVMNWFEGLKQRVSVK
jgi:hypothetical protein